MSRNIHIVKILIPLPLLFIYFILLLQYYPFIIIFYLDINKKKILNYQFNRKNKIIFNCQKLNCYFLFLLAYFYNITLLL